MSLIELCLLDSKTFKVVINNQKITAMKIFFITMITLCMLTSIIRIEAQTNDPELDQVKLLKQFVGTWENEYKQDTSVIWMLKSYGKGLEATYKIATKGKTLREAKQLVGFNKELSEFANFTLIEDDGVVIFRGKFIAKNKLWLEARDKNNPEKALSREIYEFKNPDMFTVTKEFGRYGATSGNYQRIKK